MLIYFSKVPWKNLGDFRIHVCRVGYQLACHFLGQIAGPHGWLPSYRPLSPVCPIPWYKLARAQEGRADSLTPGNLPRKSMQGSGPWGLGLDVLSSWANDVMKAITEGKFPRHRLFSPGCVSGYCSSEVPFWSVLLSRGGCKPWDEVNLWCLQMLYLCHPWGNWGRLRKRGPQENEG